ncbi:DUF726 domain-containing protein [Rhodalgimonas zhirmunskyi]|uniref:DUF726 domain-containing protein n=1 Tax=Rhodalgimonas zhirmunskyi TaxID=2964767 RepID=A0AAJ1X3P9_9RHOB|nr:DUF726 domain-containing protein [Rhodoalgimonas zhirmunskyi]MDQ2093518.1 DUF726 domain-containing protein [Rhodoalgimonas zhirmunskyi]
MPLIRVNSIGGSLRLHEQARPPQPHLARAAQAGSGPIIVMVHGYKFRPYQGLDCPHQHIFALEDGPCWKAKSWPRGLGLGRGDPDEGLGLAFGWNSRGSIRNVYARAAEAGRDLARLIAVLRRAAPERPVHAICHSLGARVVMQALMHLEPGDIGRIITLNAAEFVGAAEDALAMGAGPTAELIAVSGRENAGFEMMLERVVRPDRVGDRAMGQRVPAGARRIGLHLDREEVVARIAALGFGLEAGQRRFCHWSPYLRAGALPFYGALLRQPEAFPLDALRVVTPPSAQETARPWLPIGRFLMPLRGDRTALGA